MTDNNLKHENISLTYRLGEIHLFEKRFSGVIHDDHFTTMDPFSKFPTPTCEPGIKPDVLLYPVYPIAFEPPPIVLKKGWIIYTPQVFRNFYIDLTRYETFDDYCQQFSSKSRSTLRRKVKKFREAENGQLDWREFKKPNEIEYFFSLACQISEKTYQERLFKSGLPCSDNFISEAKALSESESVRGYILSRQGNPVAYIFCFCKKGIASYDYVGHDPVVESMSPGTVLQFLVIQTLFEQRAIRIFDFTEGEGPHKSLFSTDQQRCAKTYFFSKTFKNFLLIFFHYSLNCCVQSIGNLLKKFGIKAKVRRIIRRNF